MEDGTPDNWDLKATSSPEGAVNFMNIFTKKLKLIKNCGLEIGCLPDIYYKALSGSDYSNFNRTDYFAKAQLADGTMIFEWIQNPNCTSNTFCATMWVDINGNKPPNQMGVDLFRFRANNNGILPSGGQNDTEVPFQDYCQNSNTQAGHGCTAWVIYNENLDYLKCNDLSWDGKKNCK